MKKSIRKINIDSFNVGIIVEYHAKNPDTIEKVAVVQENEDKAKMCIKDDVYKRTLFDWYTRTPALNMSLIRDWPVVKEKAPYIAKILNKNIYSPSEWLNRFKNRYIFVYKYVSGEAAVVNSEDVECWKTNVDRRKSPKYILVLISSMWSTLH